MGSPAHHSTSTGAPPRATAFAAASNARCTHTPPRQTVSVTPKGGWLPCIHRGGRFQDRRGGLAYEGYTHSA
eukprot:1574525-Pyramimonas_sp.AAC.3